jgi:hypothetical protein
MRDGFIGHVESLTEIDKYDVKHLNPLVVVFKCSPRTFYQRKLYDKK